MVYKRIVQRGLLIVALCQFFLLANAQQILTLDKALEIANANSPSIKATLLSLERSEQTLKAQNAALKSSFSLNLTPFSYSKSRSFQELQSIWNTSETTESFGTFTISQPILPTDGTISLNNRFGWQDNKSEFTKNTESKSFSNNLYLSLNQPLFTYNKTKLNLKSLENDLENAELNYAMQKLNLEKQVTQMFYNVYFAQMQLTIAKDELANTQKTYELTQNNVEAGLAAKEELYQAEVNLATAKSSVQNNQVTLDNSKDSFKQYLGLNINDEITVMANVDTAPVQVDMAKAIDWGQKSRMELRQRQISIESAQFTMIQTKALNEFKGSMNLSVGIIGTDGSLPDIYDSPTSNPKVSVSFNIPLYDWGEKKARIAAQEASIETAKLNLSNQEVQITIDIRKSYRNLQNLVTQIEIAKQNEENSKRTFEINQEKYKYGDLSGMDMNLYQTQLSSKSLSLAQAKIDYKIELLNLKILSLYDFEKNEPVVPEKLINQKK
jgi:outer membrane protein TolC